MSQSETTVDDLKQQFLRGDLDADELRQRLRELDTETDRDELWTRWAGQGVFDAPIDQEGYTSFKGARVREVDGDGERSG